MLSDGEAKELLSFLTLEMRPDVKGQATEYILGITGTKEGCRYLRSKPDFITALLTLTKDRSVAIVKDCYHALVNLSADETLHQALVKDANILPSLFRNLLDPSYDFADRISTILSNLSRHEKTCKEVFRLPEARNFILDKERCVVQRLLPYTQYDDSTIRRGGVVGTLRNCCFDYAHHGWLLSDAVDILPFLLLPLAGPEELTEEENEGLPVDLQYLPEDKKREEDPDIRKMLIETLHLLTATKVGRQILKDKNTYPIMREFHRWETEPHVLAACEKLVQVLIGDEPEPGMENLLEVDIPEDVEIKLKDMDAKEQEQMEREKEELEKSELERNESENMQPDGLSR
ncbi:hypothetical protein AGOR_G00035980 [Albula goreensis]|uniref:Protein HGH1 homolog n=1 Tax=Albula goreensis TaxID=1534307 RepID=A0A8T3DXA7_9TELE|nr:hypothetical protein AGOR_G00035980 [Albula goreensis]